MRRNALAILLLVVLAATILLILRPGPETRHEAALAGLAPEEALAILRADARRAGADGPGDNLELLLGRLSLADGDLDTARGAYRHLLDRTGPSEDVLEALAGIEIMAGDPGLAAHYLHQAYLLAPSAARRQRLGRWYRSLRLTGAERDLLQSVPPARLSAWEAERLGQLLLHGGDAEGHEALLIARAALNDEANRPFKRHLLEVLAEAGRNDAIIDHVTGWLAGDPDPGAVLELSVRSLIGRGAIEMAVRIARQGLIATPREAHRVLPIFLRSGHGGGARVLQAEWLAARQSLTPAEWDTLITMAEASGDMRALQSVLGSAQAAQADPARIGRALLQFMRYRGPAALVPFRQLLTDEVRTAAPLVAAGWASWRGDPPATHEALIAAADDPLSEWDQLLWMSLADSLRGTPFHRALLAGAARNPDLRRHLRESVIQAQPAPAAGE